jgi:predicted amidophosphoribosyltransferase
LWFRSVRASVVFDGVAAVVVKRLKYSSREEFAPLMAGYMLSTLTEEFRGQAFDLVVPVPLHRSRD